MTPINVRAGIETVPLVDGGQVFSRVLRIEVRWQLARLGGGWVMALPVMVVDARQPAPRRIPVIDPTVVAAIALIGLALAVLRRKESSDGRGEQVSA